MRIATLAALVALGVIASACGGSSGQGVAQVESGATTTTSTGSSGSSKLDALVAYSACMRKNGLPNFPDPERSGNGASLEFDPNAPGFKDAERTCRRLLPNEGRSTPRQQAEQLQRALAYAGCMRRNGVSRFPDPRASSDGGIEWGEIGPNVGVDPRSPQFKAAEEACEELAPGAPRG